MFIAVRKRKEEALVKEIERWTKSTKVERQINKIVNADKLSSQERDNSMKKQQVPD